jgi:hypothetical protein
MMMMLFRENDMMLIVLLKKVRWRKLNEVLGIDNVGWIH